MNPRLRLPYLAAFLLCLATAIAAQTPPEAAREYTAAHRAELVQQFSELLSIPNLAADPANLKRNADRSSQSSANAVSIPGCSRSPARLRWSSGRSMCRVPNIRLSSMRTTTVSRLLRRNGMAARPSRRCPAIFARSYFRWIEIVSLTCKISERRRRSHAGYIQVTATSPPPKTASLTIATNA